MGRSTVAVIFRLEDLAGADSPTVALLLHPGLTLACVPLTSVIGSADSLPSADGDSSSAARGPRHDAIIQSASRPSPSYGPTGATPGIPTDAELEASGAVIGNIAIDNENIFNLYNPQENNELFALADHLHIKTRERVQLRVWPVGVKHRSGPPLPRLFSRRLPPGADRLKPRI
jgi:hypothetical protein